MSRGFPGLPMGISSSLALDGVGNSSCGENRSDPMKYWEIIADNLKKRGWSLGYVSAVDSEGRTIWIADAHRDSQRFIVREAEKLTAFLEIKSAICRGAGDLLDTWKRFFPNSTLLNGSESGGGLSPR